MAFKIAPHSLEIFFIFISLAQDFQSVKWTKRNTVRWSNFDRRDQKMGVFLQSTEATPCGHPKAYPRKPPADTMFMTAIVMVLP
jgi:hypothetical protein